MPKKTFQLNFPVVMGVLNMTPDSFSDGGRFYQRMDVALKAALQMEAEGAAIIDVGGESTRPFAATVSAQEELERVVPVIEKIRQNSDVIISIDTSQPEVMRAAVNAGANLINDVRALQKPGALAMAIQLNVPVCLMHMQNQPKDMQVAPKYENVVTEVKAFLQSRIEALVHAGMDPAQIIIDPGFCFGKTVNQNLQLLRALPEFCALGHPVLVGLSRKSLIGEILKVPVDERLAGSLALAAYALYNGANIIRAHDVKATVEVAQIAKVLLST